jgi:hypothetical protein
MQWLFNPIVTSALLCVLALSAPAARAETLQEYAAKCDIATGVSVPPFDCDDPAATDVPMTHPHFAANNPSQVITCDRPNRLNTACDPGSRFRVLVRTADAFVVAHCRKKSNPVGKYGDIAVIQHNNKTGATCFYQEGPASGLSHSVVAPSKANGEWIQPSSVKTENCVGCHDNGPIIRSPYLTQITGPNELPGAGDSSFNKDQPYYFVGATFADWKSHKVLVKKANPQTGTLEDNTCNTCHRMGVSNSGGGGTALDFGLRATADKPETGQNPHSGDSPLWMLPGQSSYSQPHESSAQAIAACAQRYKSHPNDPLPNGDDCRIVPFTGQPDTPDHFAAIWAKTGPGAWVARHGLSSADYQAAFDTFVRQGYRLVEVDGYELGGQPRFAALWRKVASGPWVARHGMSAADYQTEFNKNVNAGFRLTWVNGYTVQGQDFFAAIWEKSPGAAWVARHGMSADDYQATFNDLVSKGFRLALVSGYAEGNQARYAAIWDKSPTSAWVARHGMSGDDYQAEFNKNVGKGFRLAMVSGFQVAGQTLYAAIWDKNVSGAWVARHGISNTEYQAEFNAYVSQGYRLAWISGY